MTAADNFTRASWHWRNAQRLRARVGEPFEWASGPARAQGAAVVCLCGSGIFAGVAWAAFTLLSNW